MPEIPTLDRPPTHPDARPALATLAGEAGPPTMGDFQMSGQLMQTGMMVEKLLAQLSQLVPGFEAISTPFVQQMRSALLSAVNQQGPAQSGALGAGLPY